jgi:hypothetical protein
MLAEAENFAVAMIKFRNIVTVYKGQLAGRIMERQQILATQVRQDHKFPVLKGKVCIGS